MATKSVERRKARIDLTQILKAAIEAGATDVHLQGGMIPMMRLAGEIVPIKNPAFEILDNEPLRAFAEASFSSLQKEAFLRGEAIDWNYRKIPKLGTFRLNASLASGQVAITIRPIKNQIPTFQDLHLPEVLEKIATLPRGLVLFVGTTGSGKSSSLAAMINYISANQNLHIVTIEDPIEYRFPKAKGIITQKEIGSDVSDFKSALRASLRQDPDIIMIGEMRDRETFDAALLAAETGHLVFATLHTTDATETINRIISNYEVSQHGQIRNQLAAMLKAVVGQRLVPRDDKKGLVPAVEVMLNTERIRDMITDPSKTVGIKIAIEQGHQSEKMQTFDQSLISHLNEGIINYSTALAYSSNPNEFALRCKGIKSENGEHWHHFDSSDTVLIGLKEADVTLSLQTNVSLDLRRDAERYAPIEISEEKVKDLLGAYEMPFDISYNGRPHSIEIASLKSVATPFQGSSLPAPSVNPLPFSDKSKNARNKKKSTKRRSQDPFDVVADQFSAFYKAVVTATLVVTVTISKFWVGKH